MVRLRGERPVAFVNGRVLDVPAPKQAALNLPVAAVVVCYVQEEPLTCTDQSRPP